jgi:pyrimidine operon attenuation protein / uracil phosphoribosyltransferase
MSNIVLNSDDIDKKIKRLSYQIIEKNLNEKELILIGIKPNGNYLSKKIKTFINEFSNIKVSLYEMEMDKKKLLYKSCFPELKHENINKKVIIFIDDVMNSASTIMYALNKILHFFPKDIQIGVLIERTYKSFPLSANFKGLELSTSEYEHVEVILNKFSKVIIT